MSFDIAASKTELNVLQFSQLPDRASEFSADPLGVNGEIEKRKIKPLTLIAKRTASNAERKGDVRDLQREIGDRQPRRNGQSWKSNQGAPIQQSQLRSGRPVWQGRRRLLHGAGWPM